MMSSCGRIEGAARNRSSLSQSTQIPTSPCGPSLSPCQSSFRRIIILENQQHASFRDKLIVPSPRPCTKLLGQPILRSISERPGQQDGCFNGARSAIRSAANKTERRMTASVDEKSHSSARSSRACTRTRKLLCLSNGHGEDAIAVAILKELKVGETWSVPGECASAWSDRSDRKGNIFLNHAVQVDHARTSPRAANCYPQANGLHEW